MSSPLESASGSASHDGVWGIVLAFGEGMRSGEKLAGLPLPLRAILELARAGVSEIHLVIEDKELGQRLRADPRVTTEVRVHRAASLSAVNDIIEGRAVEGRASTGHVVVMPADVVGHRDLYTELVTAARQGRTAMVAGVEGLAPLVADERLLRRMADHQFEPKALAAFNVPWVVRANDDEGRERVVHELFEGCRKPVDGIVSRHLNRHVSIFVSKQIVDTHVSPNSITVATLLLGIAGALVTAEGSYGAMVLGATALQLNSILDGVDGELARVRFQHSKLGQWLDTVCDDLANTMFYAALTYATFHMTQVPAWLPWFGVAGVAGSGLTMLLYYAELIRLGSGDFYALDVGQHVERTGWWASVNRAARYVTKRDFFVFSFMVAAVLDVLPYALVVVAAGTAVTAFTGIRITLRRLAG